LSAVSPLLPTRTVRSTRLERGLITEIQQFKRSPSPGSRHPNPEPADTQTRAHKRRRACTHARTHARTLAARTTWISAAFALSKGSGCTGGAVLLGGERHRTERRPSVVSSSAAGLMCLPPSVPLCMAPSVTRLDWQTPNLSHPHPNLCHTTHTHSAAHAHWAHPTHRALSRCRGACVHPAGPSRPIVCQLQLGASPILRRGAHRLSLL